MGRSILEWSIRALLMALATGATLRIFRVRAASLLHLAWTAALVAMLLLPVWTQWGPSLNAGILPAAPQLAVRQPALRQPALRQPALRQGTATFAAATRTSSQDFAAIPEPLHAPSETQSDPVAWSQILIGAYLIGVVLMLARLIAGTIRVRHILRSARVADGFATTEHCGAPVTVGWLRPTLLLPYSWRTWPAAKLESVLIHEQEHIRRRDPLVQWLALLNRCIFWFHPVAWWIERRLALLAEEACDAAVIARGHAPHDYARYLIEIARSLNESGPRLRWAGAVSFAAGKLPRRIRRIMDAEPGDVTSRAKFITAVGLCGLLLVTCLGCNLVRSSGATSDRASGEPGVIERQQKELAQNQEYRRTREQSDQTSWKLALALSPAGATELATSLKADPGNPDKLLELVRCYQSKKNSRALEELTLWYIAQHPEARSGWAFRPEWDQVWDQDTYARGHQLWTQQLGKSWESPYVYMNAAEFMSGNDNEEAEQILQEGLRKFPPKGRYSGLHWEVFLARHYAWALAGSSGQLPPNRMVPLWDASGSQPHQNAYAQKVRANLLASRDSELLLRVVEQMQGNRPNLDFARVLNERLLSIDPENSFGHIQREHLRLFAESSAPPKDPSTMSDADRIASIEIQLNPPQRIRADAKDVEAHARELLALLSHNTRDPNYGTALFLADTTLGNIAIDRGDKREAARLLLAASQVSPTDYLRYNQLDMSLVSKLVDRGERDAAATFLERCAKFNHAGKPLARWAAAIRQGGNPRLMPIFDLFLKAG